MQAVLYSNRAMCCLKLSPPLVELAIEDCAHAQEYDPAYVKASFRRAQAHEALAVSHKSVDVARAVSQMELALTQYSRVIHVKPDHPEASRAIRRARISLERLREEQQEPLTYIDKLKSRASPRDMARDIKIVMSMFVAEAGGKPKQGDGGARQLMTTSRHQATILKSGFLSLLLDLALEGLTGAEALGGDGRDARAQSQEGATAPQPQEVTLTALRAVNMLLLSTAMADRGVQRERGEESKMWGDEGGLQEEDEAEFHRQSPRILTLFREFISTARMELQSPPLTSPSTNNGAGTPALSRTLAKLLAIFVVFVARFASHPLFSQYRKPCLGLLLEALLLPEATAHEITDEATLAVVASSIKAFASIAASDEQALLEVRECALEPLLLSSVGECLKLRKALVATLSIITGNDDIKPPQAAKDKLETLKNKQGGVGEGSKQEKDLKEREENFKQKLTHMLVGPMLANNDETTKIGLRALSLILQAYPKFGVSVVKARWQLTSQEGKVVDATTAKQVPKHFEEQKRKEAEDRVELTGDCSSDTKAQTEGKKEEEEEVGTSALQLLLFMGSDQSNESVRLLAAEVLALASSDKEVRAALMEGGDEQMFLSLLTREDHLVRAYAGVALAKMAVVGENTHTEQEHERIIGPVCEVLRAYVDEVCQRGAESGDSGSSSGGDDADAVDSEVAYGFEDDVRQRREECIRHIIETLAYLSLNVLAKKILASKNKGKLALFM